MSTVSNEITVIVAVFNAAGTLSRCLESIAAQTHPSVELIVMDGGSSDDSADILRAHQGYIAHWETQTDRGIYHAWNKALAHATGEWICFLGADDYFWTASVLERMSASLAQAFPPYRVVYGQVAIVSAAGDVLRREGRPWPEMKPGFTRTMNIPHPGLMHHHTLFEEHGLFDEDLRIAADYDLLLRELKTGDALFVPDVTVVGMQHGGVSFSPSAMPRMLQEQSRIRVKHGLPPLSDWRSMSRILFKMKLSAFLGRWVGEGGFRLLADWYRRLTGRPAIWRKSR